MYPIAAFIHYSVNLIELVDGGKLTRRKLQKLQEENNRVLEAFDEIEEQRTRG